MEKPRAVTLSDLQERVGRVVEEFSADVRQMSEGLATSLETQPEIRTYLEAAGVQHINELSPEQREEMTGVIFRVMRLRTHPGKN